jgi:hypothetical protein
MWVLCSIVVTLHAPIALAQADAQSKGLDLVCITDRPAIVEGESTSLQAWATTQDGQPPAQAVSVVWQVSEGSIQGTGSDVRWNLSSVNIMSGELHKKVKATVKVTSTGLGESTCSVEVFIGKKEQVVPGPPPIDRSGGLRSARRYLLPNEKEESGFGLYSYLLFPVQPETDEDKARYLKTLESSLRMMQSVEEHLARHRRPSELNATHIPVNAVPKYNKDFAKWAANVLEVYDYATAQKLLDKLDKIYRRGPYLISVMRQPLSNGDTPIPVHLLQDFAGKVPELVSQFVDFFTYRAAQQRTWTDESLQSFRLNLRNLVAVASKVGPGVADAVIKLVPMKQGP